MIFGGRGRRLLNCRYSCVLAAILLGSTYNIVRAECGPTFESLPANIAQAKADLIALAEDNQDKWGDEDISDEIEELTETLENWYIDNRPENEVEESFGGWRAIWLTNPFFVLDVPNVFTTDRDNTYQVVRDENLYNVVRYELGPSFLGLSLSAIVIEEAELIDEATPDTCGEKERNVWDLDYGKLPYKIRFGWFPEDIKLSDIVDDVKSGDIKTKGFPAPNSIDGEVDFIRFLDEDLRIVTHGGSDSAYLRQEYVTTPDKK